MLETEGWAEACTDSWNLSLKGERDLDGAGPLVHRGRDRLVIFGKRETMCDEFGLVQYPFLKHFDYEVERVQAPSV